MLTRIFFTSDVHGSDICFMKFLNAAKSYKANVLILGGDITGKVLVPIGKNRDGTYTTHYAGRIQTLISDKELSAFEKNVRAGGQALTSDIDLTVEENLNIYAKLYGVSQKIASTISTTS